jgi:hypothetical protein
MAIDDEVLRKIQELIPQAPYGWRYIISVKMGKSIESVNKYAVGKRGMTKSYHKDVLRILSDLVEKENRRLRLLIERNPVIETPNTEANDTDE